MQTVNVGIVGIGTVGGGLVRLLQLHHDDYLRSYGVDLRLARVCALNADRARELSVEDIFTNDWRQVTSDPEVDIVVELIGGTHPALDIFEDAFAHGKHVVSANKAMLAYEMGRLAGLAHAAGVQLRCEAAVGGGIPIVEALEHSLAGNSILTVAGIVNGTTNYMLTCMERDGLTFQEALADAQRLGYAEADPTADVDGLDAAAKAAILATIAFNTRVTRDDISLVEGIRNVSLEDVLVAKEMGYRIKLLAIARRTPQGLDVRVHPAMIGANHQLASVDGVFNAVYVVGDAVGETMFTGAGAGSFPTASAVMGDVLALATPLAHGSAPVPEAEPFPRVEPIRSPDSLHDRYYVRLTVQDNPGILASVAGVFGAHGTSLEQVRQHGGAKDGQVQVVLITHRSLEEDVRDSIEELRATEGVVAVESLIRVEDTEAWKSGSIDASSRV